jgi:hypothetical protein
MDMQQARKIVDDYRGKTLIKLALHNDTGPGDEKSIAMALGMLDGVCDYLLAQSPYIDIENILSITLDGIAVDRHLGR